MSIEQEITTKVNNELSPQHFNIENESHKHSGNAVSSHFRLVIVSEAFEGLRLIARHRKTNNLLAEEQAVKDNGKLIEYDFGNQYQIQSKILGKNVNY